MRLWHLILGLPLLAGVGLFVAPDFRAADVAAALPALLLAALLRFLFTYLLALSAFWTERAHGLVGFGDTLIFLLGGEAAPVALLPGPLQPLGAALPFRAMLGFPAEVAAGQLDGAGVLAGYGWQIVWIGIVARGGAGLAGRRPALYGGRRVARCGCCACCSGSSPSRSSASWPTAPTSSSRRC